MIGMVACSYVTNLFFKLSSVQWKKRTHCKLTFSPITFVHPDRLSSLRGNPSIRKLFLSLLVIDRSSREQVISTGTMVPLVMWCSINSPY